MVADDKRGAGTIICGACSQPFRTSARHGASTPACTEKKKKKHEQGAGVCVDSMLYFFFLYPEKKTNKPKLIIIGSQEKHEQAVTCCSITFLGDPNLQGCVFVFLFF